MEGEEEGEEKEEGKKEEEEGEPATVQPAGSVHGGPADNCRTTGRAHAIPAHRHHLQHLSQLIPAGISLFRQVESFSPKKSSQSLRRPGQA